MEPESVNRPARRLEVLGEELGAIDLLDMYLIGESRSRDYMPFPFRFTRTTRFAYLHEATAYAATMTDRVERGDLTVFAHVFQALEGYDVQVACHIQYLGPERICTRLLALRQGQRGFVIEQRSDDDVLDVRAVSPYDLGAAIASAVTLTGPGRRRRIAAPELVRGPAVSDHRGADVVVRHSAAPSADIRIPAETVRAHATVQSRWQPARRWGPVLDEAMLIWLSVAGDGDYLYVPDRSHARPMTRGMLQDNIDRLIESDIAQLRTAHGEAVDQTNWR
jgi:hypothetical protein